MNNQLTFQNVLKNLKHLYNLDFLKLFSNKKDLKIYLFGGAVRDLVLDRDWKEADIRVVINKDWAEREKILEDLLNNEVIQDKDRIETQNLTVYRFLPKGSQTHHAIDLSLTPTLNDNLPDFSINSIFVDLISGEVIDRFNGKNDIKNKTIKTVKDPNTQFTEEPHMLFRSVKCACQFDMEIEEKTFQAMMTNHSKSLDTLELIFNKKKGILIELFQSNIYRGFNYNAVKCFDLYKETSILKDILFFIADKSGLKITSYSLENPFRDNSGSFEDKISTFLSFLCDHFEGQNEVNFNKIKEVLVLNIPKEYLDFEVDINKISP